MIIHATRKLAARLPKVSKEPLQEVNVLGNWHADRLTLDRRQCVLFCHDETRAALFIAGLRKPQFAALGEIFRQLFAETLAAIRNARIYAGRFQRLGVRTGLDQVGIREGLFSAQWNIVSDIG